MPHGPQTPGSVTPAGDGLRERVRALVAKGRIGRALFLLADATRGDESNVGLHEELLDLALLAEAPEVALKASETLLKLEPGSARREYQHAVALIAAGRHAEAKDHLLRAIAREGADWHVKYALACVHQLLGEAVPAAALLREVTREVPTLPGPANALATLELKRHDGAMSAIQALLPVLDAHPTDPRTHLHLALAHARARNREAARAHATLAAESDDLSLRARAQRLLASLACWA